MTRLAVLISDIGTGTNLKAIIDAARKREINATVTVVISDTEEAQGLVRTRENNIPIIISKKKENLLNVLEKIDPDYICLAGWKQIVTDEVIDAFKNRILNTHPGLIPDEIGGQVLNPDGTKALWNKGKMTDRAMQNFLESQATYAG